jgi:tRNA (guanine37-N1)-methyltransferase
MANRPRLDVITIFPEYMNSLNLSLIGKAISANLVEIGVRDLRSFTSDNHRTVDDTPYGGGAGMVMMPTVWGDAIDSSASACDVPVHELIMLTPAGELFNQKMAYELSKSDHLIFACGRYEGIDHRITDYYGVQPNFRVREISIGDYVLNGGEAAALVMIDAIVRLIPGVIGNPDSLVEESHSLESDSGDEALVEYPNYTKPPTWRGLEVPEILTSGNHAAIAKWRRQRAAERTEKLRGRTRE